jgi:DNA (cytosine-5)-methyltransferase 1
MDWRFHPAYKGRVWTRHPIPPAVWVPSTGEIGTIDIRDAERLQGFSEDWTKPTEDAEARAAVRWRLVGNAVCASVLT